MRSIALYCYLVLFEVNNESLVTTGETAATNQREFETTKLLVGGYTEGCIFYLYG